MMCFYNEPLYTPSMLFNQHTQESFNVVHRSFGWVLPLKST